jgi:F0F1-type ATP synthase membrane subunit b/b'
MIRVLMALVAALALASSGLGTALWQARGREAVLQERNTQMAEAVERAESAQKEAAKALASLRQKNAAAARETASLRLSLAVAIAAKPENSAWAAEPVPQEVLDALASR